MRWFYPYRSFKQSRIFNTYLLYSCAHFVVEIDEKCSLNGGGFNANIMMTRDSGLLFWAALYVII